MITVGDGSRTVKYIAVGCSINTDSPSFYAVLGFYGLGRLVMFQLILSFGIEIPNSMGEYLCVYY